MAPAAVKLTELNLRGRDPHLPTLYKVHNHPLHPLKIRYGTAYLYFIDASPEGRRQAAENFDKIIFDKSGSNEKQREAGLLQLKPGDMLFTRRIGDDPAGLQDHCKCLFLGREFYREEKMQEMLALQQELLCDPNQRTREKPHIDSGSGR
ncbi:hypothetical protein EVG20_g7667, partial [Dentipellis fragilis]